ncbi:MAG: hypothetical protein KIG36_06875 [Eubacteriales bacterium]|nr:hypothetical protein [Eubacteriales bacterium]
MNCLPHSDVRFHNGIPTLFVDGNPVAANAYMSYFTDNARYGDFARASYRLFSLPVFFAERTINDSSQIPPFDGGVFETDPPDFALADRVFEKVLAASPDAMIFPRVNVSLPIAWERANPDELCDFGFTENRRPCFSSDAWASETKRLLGLFLDYLKSAPYARHIVGIQIAGGNTEEWYPYDLKGSIGRRSREHFDEYARRHGLDKTEEAYYAFLSHVVASRIDEFAAFTKERTDRRVAVGAFYGYTLECPYRELAHAALGELLRSENVDFICSPISYAEYRPCGKDTAYLLPVDSVKEHGKLYFVENDTRTHLTTPPNDMPAYNAPVWQPKPHDEAIESIKKHYARALTHSNAAWWFDMWGGWYADEECMSLMRDMLAVTRASLAKPLQSASEVAVFVDENAIFSQPDGSVTYPVIFCARDPLGRMGAPYDSYLASDYEAVKSRYRAYVFLIPCQTPLSCAMTADAAARGIPFLALTSEKRETTTEELRALCRAAGVHLWCGRDAVIYANASYVFLHTTQDGEYDLAVPAGESLTPLLGAPQADFPMTLPGKTGYLYERVRKTD